MAKLVDVPHLVATHERGIPGLDDEQRQLLLEAGDIVIVDDVVITGRRIEGFRQQLIALRRHAGLSGDVNLGCLIGVARPRDARAFQGSADFVHHRTGSHHSFAAVETLFLPNWDERHCPWCREFRLLRSLPREANISPLVAERIAQLAYNGGLNQVFFSLSEEVDEAGNSNSGTPKTKESWKELSEADETTVKYADDLPSSGCLRLTFRSSGTRPRRGLTSPAGESTTSRRRTRSLRPWTLCRLCGPVRDAEGIPPSRRSAQPRDGHLGSVC